MPTKHNPLDAAYTEGAVTDAAELYDNWVEEYENGGTMIGAWMAFGSDDLVVVADMPDDASMAGVALAVSATGAIEGGKTTKLLDMLTAVEGMKKAKAVLDVYQPPS